MTHEQFITAIRDLVVGRVGGPMAERVGRAKVTYGVGKPGIRGVTYFDAWHKDGQNCDVLEVAAMGEESALQLAGTTVHELAHVLAGHAAGHSEDWKDACRALGLVEASAAGQVYDVSHFDGVLWGAIEKLAMSDGAPVFGAGVMGVGLPTSAKIRPCPMGIGTRGGKSRGIGSGSRLLKVVCPGCGYTARVTAKWLAIGPLTCPCGEHLT